MIIANSSIGMDSVRTYTSVSRESVNASGGLIVSFGDKIKEAAKEKESDKLSEENEKEGLESNAKEDFDNIYEQMKSEATSGRLESRMERDEINRIKVQCIQYLLYCLFGIKYDEQKIASLESEPLEKGAGAKIGFYTYEKSYSSFYAEQEETSFSTTGKVVTADGREIEFGLELSMSRSFASYYEENVSVTKMFTDPLVINLDGPAANVSDIKIQFDLDADGSKEDISILSGGSGYLALDNNGDGIVNDGSELFGTKSGDGFKDLAAYDSDGNGFIDEADEIFDKLRICVFDEEGNQTLYKLKDKDVGAICLQSADTEFSLNNEFTNEVNARIRKTGIFLYENGGVGTVQHLDLAQ